MDTLIPAAAAAVVAFLAVSAVSPPAATPRDTEVGAKYERDQPPLTSRQAPANDVRRDLVVEVSLSRDAFPAVSIATQSNVDGAIGFESETVIVSASGELLSNTTPFGRSGSVHALSPRSRESREVSLAELPPGLYAVRTTIRGGTESNLEEQIAIIYIRVTARGGVEEIEYREWNEQAAAAQGTFVRSNGTREVAEVQP